MGKRIPCRPFYYLDGCPPRIAFPKIVVSTPNPGGRAKKNVTRSRPLRADSLRHRAGPACAAPPRHAGSPAASTTRFGGSIPNFAQNSSRLMRRLNDPGQRMADIARRHPVTREKTPPRRGRYREGGQPSPAGVHPALPPGPRLRSDQVNHRNTRRGTSRPGRWKSGESVKTARSGFSVIDGPDRASEIRRRSAGCAPPPRPVRPPRSTASRQWGERRPPASGARRTQRIRLRDGAGAEPRPRGKRKDRPKLHRRR